MRVAGQPVGDPVPKEIAAAAGRGGRTAKGDILSEAGQRSARRGFAGDQLMYTSLYRKVKMEIPVEQRSINICIETL